MHPLLWKLLTPIRMRGLTGMAASDDGLRDLARRLLDRETGEAEDIPRLVEGIDRACQKLRSQIVAVLGPDGFKATLSEAASRTQRDFPYVAVHPTDGEEECLKGMQECLQGRGVGEAREALATLWANFLDILTGLVGRDLTLGFVRAAWPDTNTA